MNFFYLLSTPLGWVMKQIYNLIPNYGITIILFTILVRVVSFPLAVYQQKSTAKMSVFQPMMQEIQNKYKNNQEKMNEEMTRLQQEYGYNPLSGCLPMALNMFVLFGVIGAVYYPLQKIWGISGDVISTIASNAGITNKIVAETTIIQMAHQGASMPELTAEQYQTVANFNVTFMGMDLCNVPTLGFNLSIILPVIALITMLISNAYTMSSSGQQMQGSMKAMPWMMSLFFAWFCFTVPLAFSLYYCVSNVLMLVQQFLCKKIYDPEKLKEQAKAEMEAKKKEAKKRKTVTVVDEKTGKSVTKEVGSSEMAKLRLERARKLDEEKYKDERTERLQ